MVLELHRFAVGILRSGLEHASRLWNGSFQMDCNRNETNDILDDCSGRVCFFSRYSVTHLHYIPHAPCPHPPYPLLPFFTPTHVTGWLQLRDSMFFPISNSVLGICGRFFFVFATPSTLLSLSNSFDILKGWRELFSRSFPLFARIVHRWWCVNIGNWIECDAETW